jgi:hypothetical protein
VQCTERGYHHVIIDVEPTAGFERLLTSATSTVQSLLNLKKQGVLTLSLLGAKWPDIAGYLKDDYIKRADFYTARIEHSVELIKGAKYLLVATPEESPVDQTFEVARIIEKFDGVVHGYVVNNIRGESHESGNIQRLVETGLPLVRIGRRRELHAHHPDRLSILAEIGREISVIL